MVRVPCNFCEFSSSSSGQDQDNEEAVLREEVERLQFLIKRMSGRDDDASYTELEAHERRLKAIIRIVRAKKKKIKPEEDERVKSTSSSEKRQEKPNYRLNRLKSESLRSKLERLRLLNERMNGREIESMTSYDDLLLLETQMMSSFNGLTDQMMRPRHEQVARMRSDLTKEVRVVCDFCGLSSSNRCQQSPDKQEDESLLMESELKRLRLLTRRMTGKDLDGLSFDEYQLLRTNLNKALRIVKKLKTEQEEAERLRDQEKRKQRLRPRKQKRKAGDKDEATMISSGEKRDDEAPPKLVGRIESKRVKAEAMKIQQIEYERLRAEPMESQLERLWLLKERMSGRELGNMTSSALRELEIKLMQGLRKMASSLAI
ncbi:hypothetical protein V5N11_001876 [Cardamine amara subsp. amara]|uniref:Uncharacterized protein n=1 Tax=Cardamine amara subsp. amara TaxID=228776 RepID=A0ABD1AJC2_CARAN